MSTNGSSPPNLSTNFWYDFNGNGTLDGAYILHGHECLVFFLGGVPVLDNGTQAYGMMGFGKDPTNPFSNSVIGSSMYNANRQPPFFEFNAGRLFLDSSNSTTPVINGVSYGIPGYYDSVGNGPPRTGSQIGLLPALSSPTINFFAYFSAYGNGNYDPNDVNFYEADQNLSGPISLTYYVNFPTYPGTTVAAGNGTAYPAISPAPNPYTSTLTAGTTSGTITYQKPQTFQIISPGIDGLYGVGGQYVSDVPVGHGRPLPFDSTHTTNSRHDGREHPAARVRQPDQFQVGEAAITESAGSPPPGRGEGEGHDRGPRPPAAAAPSGRAAMALDRRRDRPYGHSQHRSATGHDAVPEPMRGVDMSQRTWSVVAWSTGSRSVPELRRRRSHAGRPAPNPPPTQRTLRRRAGFTFVELLVVMVIISIILGFILNAGMDARRRAEERATQGLITKLETGLSDRLDALLQTRPGPNTAHLALAAVYNSLLQTARTRNQAGDVGLPAGAGHRVL